jgi:hypothetical protein
LTDEQGGRGAVLRGAAARSAAVGRNFGERTARAAQVGPPKPVTPARQPVRCFACRTIVSGGLEGHYAEAARQWAALERAPEERCDCWPCAMHTRAEHDQADACRAEREDEERRRDERVAPSYGGS